MGKLESLKSEFKTILKEVTWVNPEFIMSNNGGDETDQALLNEDLEFNAKLKGRHFRYLKKIKLALTKMERGDYGVCEHCECSISETRLKARPTAQACLDCQEEKELFESKCQRPPKRHLSLVC